MSHCIWCFLSSNKLLSRRFLWFSLVQDVGMLYSPRVTSRDVNITFYQRTLLGMSANQKRHYLKSFNKNNNKKRSKQGIFVQTTFFFFGP